jgi:hypothetical protein
MMRARPAAVRRGFTPCMVSRAAMASLRLTFVAELCEDCIELRHSAEIFTEVRRRQP